VVNPTILDFIPENEEETNLSTKLVVSKEKDKIETLFTLICSLKSQSAIVFCNHRDAAERISDTLNEKEFILPTIMVEWIKMRESVL
jgi:superfamily II DNA/RNA helicase